MVKPGKVSFNEVWAKTVDKQTFIAVHEHAHPHLNLKAEYDRIVAPKKEGRKSKKSSS